MAEFPVVMPVILTAFYPELHKPDHPTRMRRCHLGASHSSQRLLGRLLLSLSDRWASGTYVVRYDYEAGALASQWSEVFFADNIASVWGRAC